MDTHSAANLNILGDFEKVQVSFERTHILFLEKIQRFVKNITTSVIFYAKFSICWLKKLKFRTGHQLQKSEINNRPVSIRKPRN